MTDFCKIYNFKNPIFQQPMKSNKLEFLHEVVFSISNENEQNCSLSYERNRNQYFESETHACQKN